MRVDIFIKSSFKSPRKSTGKVIYVLRIKKGGEEKTIVKTYTLRDATPDMADRRTLIVALRHLIPEGGQAIHSKYEPHIYLDRPTVKTAVTQWSEGWIKNGWKTSKGEPVRYGDEWKKLIGLIGESPVEFHVGERHEFSHWMEGELEKCLKSLESSTAGKK